MRNCVFAVRTRLELATYGVTGRYSNQLNYRTLARTTARATSGKTLVIALRHVLALRLRKPSFLDEVF